MVNNSIWISSKNSKLDRCAGPSPTDRKKSENKIFHRIFVYAICNTSILQETVGYTLNEAKEDFLLAGYWRSNDEIFQRDQ